MKTIFRSIPLALSACLFCGCGGGPVEPTAEDNATARVEASSVESSAPADTGFVPLRPTTPYNDPARAVRDFLTAVRDGDDETATALLSTAAQEEAWQNGMAISADGFPDATFEVSDVEYLRENSEAQVMSVWSDVATGGDAKSFRCVWLLTREPHGWCVRGMATKFLETMDPIVLDFANQAEMIEKQRWAEQQIALHRYQQQQLEDSTVRQATHTTENVVR